MKSEQLERRQAEMRNQRQRAQPSGRPPKEGRVAIPRTIVFNNDGKALIAHTSGRVAVVERNTTSYGYDYHWMVQSKEHLFYWGRERDAQKAATKALDHLYERRRQLRAA